eukprot:CAMPEP_0197004998 /NCGR_PEP_ID=MMETSP1380-20130617/27042_1 /TAXON_ID=5936 /ORGANISM="Euplotes crassus, Strain CT5" /LENGTH=41 /DNA_ID= /DNA_START= /DNA_END= /DNA_ORIENTATION=
MTHASVVNKSVVGLIKSDIYPSGGIDREPGCRSSAHKCPKH